MSTTSVVGLAVVGLAVVGSRGEQVGVPPFTVAARTVARLNGSGATRAAASSTGTAEGQATPPTVTTRPALAVAARGDPTTQATGRVTTLTLAN